MILKRLTLARFRRMLPDDGPKGPKHVGAILRKDILNINCSILCFNKRCICWQNSFVFMLVLICLVDLNTYFLLFYVFPIIYVFQFLSICFLQMFECISAERTKLKLRLQTCNIILFDEHLR